MAFSPSLVLGCFVLLLLLMIATVNGQPKCKSYKPPKNNGGGGQQNRKKRLAGGTLGDIEKMPWMVYLSTTYTRTFGTQFANCSGTLISRRHVLTVQHCVNTGRMLDNNTISVRYGAANRTEGNLIVRDKYAVHIHPNYTSYFNATAGIFVESKGLAVVDLGQDLEFDDNVHSICLACLNDTYPQGEGIIAGWGDQLGACHPGVPSVYPEVFRYANASFHQCLTSDFAGADMVCSQADSTHSVGGGDSGGPFIAPVGPTGEYMQVCANGVNNCNPRENACTRIYGDWLEEVTGVKCQSYEAPPSM